MRFALRRPLFLTVIDGGRSAVGSIEEIFHRRIRFSLSLRSDGNPQEQTKKTAKRRSFCSRGEEQSGGRGKRDLFLPAIGGIADSGETDQHQAPGRGLGHGPYRLAIELDLAHHHPGLFVARYGRAEYLGVGVVEGRIGTEWAR